MGEALSAVVKGVNSQGISSISYHKNGLVDTGSGTLNEWPMHMIMRHSSLCIW